MDSDLLDGLNASSTLPVPTDKSSIVARDSVGSFSANLITGTVTNANTLNGANANGFISRIGTDLHSSRVVTGSGNDITVANGDGVSGNPTISAGTNLSRRDATNTYTLPQNFALITANALSNDGNSNLFTGVNNLSPTSTDGFVYVPMITGVPTGIPTTNVGRSPIVWDASNNRMWTYSGGAWNSIGLSATDIQNAGFKNKIIGGDFTLNPWQRGTSLPSLGVAAYLADRWQYNKTGTAVVSASKSTDAPTITQADIFSQHSLSLAVTTTLASVASADFHIVGQKIEGFNCANFAFGQAGTRFITKSFWVKGSKVGIHCLSFRNSALNRSYIKEYTINTANTWEFKSVTIPVDTAGVWLYDNGIGLNVQFALAAGTTYQTVANTWMSGNFLSTANQVNELDTIGNTFKIALIQLEANSKVTPYEVRDIGSVTLQCYRYTRPAKANARFFATAAGQGASSTIAYDTMRDVATVSTASAGLAINATSATITTITDNGARFNIVSAAAGDCYVLDRELLFVSEL